MSKPSAAATRTAPSLAGCPVAAAVPAELTSTRSASLPSSARSAATASGLRHVLPVHTNRMRNAGWDDMRNEDRCEVSRASTAFAREVVVLAQPRRDVERAAAKELRPGPGDVHQRRRNPAQPGPSVEHQVELVAERRDHLL